MCFKDYPDRSHQQVLSINYVLVTSEIHHFKSEGVRDLKLFAEGRPSFHYPTTVDVVFRKFQNLNWAIYVKSLDTAVDG